jgi:raffinose/stachyose/melibiose transport system permease protein
VTRPSRLGGALLWLVCAVFLLPLGYMAVAAVRTSGPAFSSLLADMHYTRSLANTLLVTVFTCGLVAALGSMAGYPLGPATASWSTAGFRLLMLAASLPVVLILAPLYLTLRELHLLDTTSGLVLVFTAVNLPVAVVFYAGRLRQLPRELEDAASCDGCGPVRTYRSVVVPFLRPVTATLLTFVTVQIWSDLLIPLAFVGDPRRRTVMANAYALADPYHLDPARLLPAAAMGSVPLLLLLLCFRRQITAGLLLGSVTT